MGKEFGVQLLPVKVQYNDAQEENTTREIILLKLEYNKEDGYTSKEANHVVA